MATLISQLIVSLLDRVTAPARAVNAALGKLTAAQTRNNARLDAMRGRMLEAAAVAYGLARAISAPVNAATAFETKLEDIGQKINEPVANLPKLGLAVRQVARDTTQTAAAIAEGMDVLAGMGASRSDALALLNPIGRAATAYNAEIADLSQAGYAALDNLKVPAQEFGRALDAMAVAGKEGAFELKDMAKYFPQLGAGYQALKQTGVPAVADLSAALQIVRKGTGDSASAATNLSNILQKVNAPLTRKNFAKMGVNLEKEMAKAAKKGMTPIEAIVEITNRTLKGNLGRLGDLFNDAQVQQGLRPLIQNLDEYRRIRAEALAAQGVVEEDYQRRLQTGALATQRWRIALESLNLAIGNALLPALTSLANDLIPIINRMADWADKHPALTRAIVATTAALIGLRVAALAAQFALLWMRGGLISAAIVGLRMLAAAVAPVVTAMRILRFVMLGTGIGAALVGIALAGAWIAENWAGIGVMFEAFRGAFARAIEPVMPLLRPVIDGFAWLWDTVSGLIGPIDEMGGGWARAGLAAGRFAGDLVVAMVDLPGKVGEAFAAGWQTVVGWFDAGVQSVSDFAAKIGALASGNESAWRNLGFAIGEAIGGAIRSLMDLAPRAFEALVSAAVKGGTQTVDVVRQLGRQIGEILASVDLSAIGRQIIESLLAGIKAAASSVKEYVRNLGAGIKSAVSGYASGLVSGVKSGLGMGGDSPAVAGGRAAGGPVRASLPYLVGERGPEIVTFQRNGFVHDAVKTARMMRGAALASAVAMLAAAAPGMQPGQSTHVDVGGVTIVVQGAPGQSPDQVAAAVERMLSAKLNALSRGAFSDGAN